MGADCVFDGSSGPRPALHRAARVDLHVHGRLEHEARDHVGLEAAVVRVRARVLLLHRGKDGGGGLPPRVVLQLQLHVFRPYLRHPAPDLPRRLLHRRPEPSPVSSASVAVLSFTFDPVMRRRGAQTGGHQPTRQRLDKTSGGGVHPGVGHLAETAEQVAVIVLAELRAEEVQGEGVHARVDVGQAEA